MKIHEYQAKQILSRYNIPVQKGEVASSPEEARELAKNIGGMVVVKAQVHAGGRGKAGGVKLAKTPDEAEEKAQAILGMNIKGSTVRRVLVTQAADIAKEFYLGVIIDRGAKGITLMGSSEGGVEIEEVAKTSPEKIIRVTADPFLGLGDFQARELAFGMGIEKDKINGFVTIAKELYRAFVENDADILEINPLILNDKGEWQALDAKMVYDDNALYRHREAEDLRDLGEEEQAEIEARKAGLAYVKLDGNIGCVVNGAGLAMATMDTLLLYGGEPANFLDIGGGAKADKVTAAIRIILSDPKVKAILFNIFGGITRGDDVAKGIIAGLEQIKTDVPIVIRLVGTNSEEGRKILEDANLKSAETLAEAAQKVVYVAKERS
ncbi:MAG: ADP-forming succinate--CoA ligase subunit beta [Chloroflexi bacterium]|nr:ADP-forming succinate--CoA ligase subunit beta [Chloroflexota bacterium]OJV89459.1 MAG: succinate--CoA ligase subunit beta [Chloroflexi bacterium 54-19]